MCLFLGFFYYLSLLHNILCMEIPTSCNIPHISYACCARFVFTVCATHEKTVRNCKMPIYYKKKTLSVFICDIKLNLCGSVCLNLSNDAVSGAAGEMMFQRRAPEMKLELIIL